MWTLKKWINKKEQYSKVQIVVFVVWLLSCVWFFVTSWTTACQLPCPSLSPGVRSNSCLLWLSRYTFSGAISNCPLLFSNNILNTLWPGGAGLIFWCRLFLPFHTVHDVLTAVILEQFAIPSSTGPRFVRTVTLPSWVALHNNAHSFIELQKLLCHNKVDDPWRRDTDCQSW